jgi:hypothetical protein
VTDKRQKVIVSNPAVAADWLRLELGRGELACLFRRKDLIVHTPRVGEEGYVTPTAKEIEAGVDHGPAQVQTISSAQIKALIEVRYNVGRNRLVADKRTKAAAPADDEVDASEDEDASDDTDSEAPKRKQWVSTLFPPASVSSAVEGGRIGEGTPNLQDLRGVTHTPILRPDGSVLDQPGYDRSTGMLFLPDRNLTVVRVPEKPTPAEIRAAVDFILKPIAQFPFVHEAHRANWCGYTFTPLLRPLLPPPYQGQLIDATNPGSGKGFLAKMQVILHGGVLKGALPGDNDEIRKVVTAVLLDTTAPIVQFDNVVGIIRSAALEALLTTDVWSDRWLGHSRDIEVPNDRVWSFTGNNAKVGGDMARRTNPVSLDPGVPDPHNRTGFKLHPPTWMKQHRGQYLAALLTVARAWVLDGAPKDITRSDDYTEWAGSLRGMLTWAGIPGLFGGETETDNVDSSDDAEWGTFLAAIYDQFKSDDFTVRDVVARLGTAMNPIDTALLPGDMAHKFAMIRSGDDGDFRKSLGWWFKNRCGRFAQGWTVRKVSDKTAKSAEYRIFPPPSGFTVSPVPSAPVAPNRGVTPAPPTTSEPSSLRIGVTETGETVKPHGDQLHRHGPAQLHLVPAEPPPPAASTPASAYDWDDLEQMEPPPDEEAA